MLEGIENESLLVNAIGHSAGLLLFAGFLVLYLRDHSQKRTSREFLPVVTASLALLWNLGSLFVLGATSGLYSNSDLVVALSFTVLSLLPATLLQSALGGRHRTICIIGYLISGLAVTLHLGELARPDVRFHYAALWVIIGGFGGLTVVAMFAAQRTTRNRVALPVRRTAMSMCLFLFAISFVHFSHGHVREAWSSEVALHHAGIPLALFVLLQDYRFLLVDAFLRFFVNGLTAGVFIVLTLALNAKFHLQHRASENQFIAGILLVTACLVLIALVFVRGKLQLALTRIVFGRSDSELAVGRIREAGQAAQSEAIFLESATSIAAEFVRTSQSKVEQVEAEYGLPVPTEPTVLYDSGPATRLLASQQSWAIVCVPARFTKGDAALIFLGRREGGRRYLSEDLRELARLSAVITEQVERYRSCEIELLVSQAELRALQSQINPHFLFNSLNTLYGTIPRESAEARRMVLNLAEIFRYALRSDRTLIPLSEEVQIIRAYLEIEQLRLGDKLRTQIELDERAGSAMIPVLSIQPLVENAIKHGISHRSGGGTVRVSALTGADGVHIEVSDDGAGFQACKDCMQVTGSGIGLDNVRQRLKLCFGESASIHTEFTERGSTVAFLVPASSLATTLRPRMASI